MKLTKIYTKTGDEGMTSLVGGIRVRKDSPRLEAYGTMDELSSQIGLLIANLNETELKLLQRVQNNLFNISSMLATDVEALRESEAEWVGTYLESLERAAEALEKTETPLLEQEIDRMNAEMEPLDSFILPGGSVAAAQCHVCRAVCRRAERRAVAALNGYEGILRYINRLSDYLFVLARKINIICGMDEKKWENPCK